MDSFQKRERERKKLQNRRDKADRKRERAEHPVSPVGDAAPSDAELQPQPQRDAPPEATKPSASPA